MTNDAERIAVLEANVRHMERKIDGMAEKVDEMHGLLLQARGFRWFIVGIAGLAGLLASKLGAIAVYLGFRSP